MAAPGTLLGKLRYEIELNARGALNKIPGLRRAFAGLSKGALGAAAGIATIGIVSAAVLKKALDAAKEFETAWAEVRTIMAATEQESRRLAAGILEMSTAIPQSAVGLARGFYQTISAGIVDTKDAMKVLETSARASVAGLTSTFTAVDVMTSTMNAFRLEAKDTEDVADTLFTTVREGKLTFETLAQSIGPAIPFFAQAGLKLEELTAAMATLTKGGLDARIAATALRAAIVQVLKPSDQARETALRLGLEFNAAALKAKGFIGFLKDVKEKTDGNVEAITQLFPNIRGLAAVLNLAGNQLDEFGRISEAMTNRAGNMNAAFEVMNDTLENQRKLLANKVKKVLIDIGNTFLNEVTRGVMAFSHALDGTDARLNRHAAQLKKTGDQLNKMEHEGERLAKRYDELKAKKKLTTDEAEELRKVIKQLADLFPDFVTEVNNLGEALDFDTAALRRFRKALRESFDKDIVNAIKDRFKRMRALRQQQAHAMREIAEINRQISAQAGRGLIMSRPGDTSSMMTVNQARKHRDELKDDLVKITGQLDALNDISAEFFEMRGLDDLIVDFDRLTDTQNRTAEQEKELVTITTMLEELFGKGAWKTIENDVLKIAHAMRELRDAAREANDPVEKLAEAGFEMVMTGLGPLPRKLQFAGPPGPHEMSAAATKAAFDAMEASSQAAEQALEEFVERTIGLEFMGSSFQTLPSNVRNYWENVKAEFDAAQQKAAEAVKAGQIELIDVQADALKDQLVAIAGAGLDPSAMEPMFEALREQANALGPGFEEAQEIVEDLWQDYLDALHEHLVATGQVAGPQLEDLKEPFRFDRDAFDREMLQLELNVADVTEEVRQAILDTILGTKAVADLMKEIPEELQSGVLDFLKRMAGEGAPIKASDVRRETKARESTKKSSLETLQQFRNLAEGITELGAAAFGATPALSNFIAGLFDVGSAVASGAGPLGIAAAGLSLIGGLFGSSGDAAQRAAERMRKLKESISAFLKIIIEEPGADISAGAPLLRGMLDQIKKIRAIDEEIRQIEHMIDVARMEGDLARVAILEGEKRRAERRRDAEREILADLKKEFEERFPDIDLPSNLADLAKFINDTLGDLEEVIENFGKFLVKTFQDLRRELDFTQELLDIEDPAEKMDLLIKRIKELSGLDLGFLQDMSVGSAEKAIEALGQFVTGTGAAAEARAAFDAGDMAALIETDFVKGLAQTLGLPLEEVVQLLADILFNGLASTEEIADMILALEGLNDEMKSANEIGEENITVSRNVSITQAQGDTIIAIMHTTRVLLEAIMRAVDTMAEILREIQISSGGEMNVTLTANFNVTFAPGTDVPTAGRRLAAMFVEDVEDSLRAKGVKMIGQGR